MAYVIVIDVSAREKAVINVNIAGDVSVCCTQKKSDFAGAATPAGSTEFITQ